MDLSIIWDSSGVYLEGLKNTVVLVSLSLLIGLLLAIPLAVLRKLQKPADRMADPGLRLLFPGHPAAGTDVSYLLRVRPV